MLQVIQLELQLMKTHRMLLMAALQLSDTLTGSGITVNPGATNISLNNNTITNILLPGGSNYLSTFYGYYVGIQSCKPSIKYNNR